MCEIFLASHPQKVISFFTKQGIFFPFKFSVAVNVKHFSHFIKDIFSFMKCEIKLIKNMSDPRPIEDQHAWSETNMPQKRPIWPSFIILDVLTLSRLVLCLNPIYKILFLVHFVIWMQRLVLLKKRMNCNVYNNLHPGKKTSLLAYTKYWAPFAVVSFSFFQTGKRKAEACRFVFVFSNRKTKRQGLSFWFEN